MALEFKNYDPATFYGALRSETAIAVTEGSVIVGDSAGVGTELDASTTTQIMVGNGTTITSVAVSGDATMTNAGVMTVSGATAAFDATGEVSANSGTATTAGGVDAINIGTSDAIKITFGSGVPTLTAPQGSLYLRTDGSSTSTRLYVNTTGSTTWTNVTTAA